MNYGDVKSVSEYIAALPADRQVLIKTVMDALVPCVPKGYELGIQYKMIGWFVPHSIFPDGYHCDPKEPLGFMHLASQKNYCSLYLFGCYTGTEQRAKIEKAYADAGIKMNMGVCCLRFKKLSEIPLEAVGKIVSEMDMDSFLGSYQAALASTKTKKK